MAEPLLAVLWVDDFPLQALCRAAPVRRAEPLVVVRGIGHGGGARILLATAVAQARGARPGMTVAQGRARCPELVVQRRAALLEASAREALAEVARAVSPRVELGADETNAWAFCDVAGTSSRCGPPLELARTLRRALTTVGLDGRVALARTKLLARLAVKVELDPPIVPPDEAAERRFLDHLPLAALEPEPELGAMLARFGLCRVADLLALPAGEAANRLGPEGARLLARARGEEPVGLQPTPEVSRPSERQGLDDPLDNLAPLLVVLRGLIDRLIRRLALGGLFVAALRLTLDYEAGGHYLTTLAVGAPTRDAQVLVALLRLRLTESPPEQSVTAVEVSAEPCAGRIQQLDLFAPRGPLAAELALTISRLAALCGPERIGAPLPLDSYQEDAFTMGRFADQGQAPLPAPRSLARALRRLRPPQPIEVLRHGARLLRLESPRLKAAIQAARGPFRVDEGWWRAPAPDTAAGDFDVWDVELDDGRVARLAELRPAQRWLLLGWYD